MRLIFLFTVVFVVFSCKPSRKREKHVSFDFNKRQIDVSSINHKMGKSYLATYSQIYSQNNQRKNNLTVTVSIRNTNTTDTLFLTNASYYNTKGELIKNYASGTSYILPMETAEIVIAESDNKGGTGSNFIFDWLVNQTSSYPIFEAVMISTAGQQGLSFTTSGIRLK